MSVLCPHYQLLGPLWRPLRTTTVSTRPFSPMSTVLEGSGLPALAHQPSPLSTSTPRRQSALPRLRLLAAVQRQLAAQRRRSPRVQRRAARLLPRRRGCCSRSCLARPWRSLRPAGTPRRVYRPPRHHAPADPPVDGALVRCQLASPLRHPRPRREDPAARPPGRRPLGRPVHPPRAPPHPSPVLALRRAGARPLPGLRQRLVASAQPPAALPPPHRGPAAASAQLPFLLPCLRPRSCSRRL